MSSAQADLDSLAEDLAEIELDLPSFGELLQIKTKGEGKVTFDFARWHPEQKRFERERTGRDLVVKPRQIGFSTLENARDYQYARTHEGAQVVVVVHSGEAKSEFFSAIRLMDQSLRAWGLSPEPRENTKTGLRWDDNDSSIKVIEAGKDEITAADRGRSGTIQRLHITEAAFYRAPEETMAALFGSLGENECVIESTANGVGNWFHSRVEEARKGLFDNYALHFFSWLEHPGYIAEPGSYPAPPAERDRHWETKIRAAGASDAQIAWWRKTVQKLGLERALREYPVSLEAAFLVSGESWLDTEHLDWLRMQTRQPIDEIDLVRGLREFGALRLFEKPERGRTYLVIVDPSEGTGGNEAAMTVMDHRSGRVVATWENNRVKPGELAHPAAQAGRLYNNALLVVERNVWRRASNSDGGGGVETLNVLEREERYPRLYRDEKGVLGWSTNELTRPLIFGDLAKAIEERAASTPCAKTVEEAASLMTGKNGRPEARGKRNRKGQRFRGDDGLFVCWGIGLQVRSRTPMPGTARAVTTGQLESTGFRT